MVRDGTHDPSIVICSVTKKGSCMGSSLCRSSGRTTPLHSPRPPHDVGVHMVQPFRTPNTIDPDTSEGFVHCELWTYTSTVSTFADSSSRPGLETLLGTRLPSRLSSRDSTFTWTSKCPVPLPATWSSDHPHPLPAVPTPVTPRSPGIIYPEPSLVLRQGTSRTSLLFVYTET